MRDATTAIIASVYNKINGNISVPVYTHEPKGHNNKQYVVLSQPDFNPFNCKGNYGKDATILVEVICKFDTGKGSFIAGGNIADEISQLLVQRGKAHLVDISGYNHRITDIMHENTQTVREETETKTLYRTFTRYRVLLEDV